MSTKKVKTDKKEASLPEAKKTAAVFKGKYISAIGRRKTAIAEVRFYAEGSGQVIINGLPLEKYFNEAKAAIALSSLKLAGLEKNSDLSVLVHGGGINAQAEAMRHGIARALVELDPEIKGSMKAKGWMTRDSREVERKKFGLKKARRAPQWSKR